MAYLSSINLAVSLSWPMINSVGHDKPTTFRASGPIPAEGPIFRVGLDQSAACAEARSIYASLAAAPLFAAVGRKFQISR